MAEDVEVPTGHVTAGRHELRVGAAAGTLIVSSAGRGDPAEVARALEDSRTPAAVAEGFVDAASEATARAEEAVDLYRAAVTGSLLDPGHVNSRVEVMLDVLERLDRTGHHAEALRLARAINGLLALLMRWAELARALRTALRAADHVRDRAASGWAQHELGTLHLAADEPVAAQRHLEAARAIRSEAGDREGLAATEHNLGFLCRQLRDFVRDGRLRPPQRPRRVLILAAVILAALLIGAVVADAVVSNGDVATAPHLLVQVDGRGAVTSRPAAIDCPAVRCDAPFASHQHVTLTAKARPGSKFAGWGGACRGRGPCRLELDGDRAVTARFVRAASLQVHPAGDGHGQVTSLPPAIACGSRCTAALARGTKIVLTARADGRSTFAGWSGACTGIGRCRLTMYKSVAVTALFVARTDDLPPVRLTVAPEGTGEGTVTAPAAGIACRPDCTATLPSGTTVTLTADADRGSTFTGWSVAGCAGSDACTVTVGDSRTVTATFQREQVPRVTLYTLTDGPGSVTPACSNGCTHAQNDVVSVVATPAAGASFTGWVGCPTESTSGNTCRVTMSGDERVTATFRTDLR